MIRLVYNNKAFKILNEFQFNQNNKEVTFNDITIDFTGHSIADIPLKLQEIQIKQCKDNQDIFTQGKTIFFGYVDTIQLGKMQMSEEKRELTITLLSPLKLSTLRTSTIIGTYLLTDALYKIFEPLINDGFEIVEMNVPQSQILVSYIMETIETIMNNLGLKKNIFWTIDAQKHIKINSIEYLFGQNIVKTITTTQGKILNIEPSIQASDYANVINIKNARLIYRNSTVVNGGTVTEDGGFPIISLPKSIQKGDTVNFNYPVIISKQIAQQILQEKHEEEYDTIVLLEIVIGTIHLTIFYNQTTEQLDTTIQNGTVTYSDDEGSEGTLVLQRDNFFNNLITGIKYNGNSTLNITTIYSDSALRYITMKFMHSGEIEKLKGIVSQSGQVEKTIDVNETWYTLQELTNYARSLLIENTNTINTIVLEYDQNQDLEIGDLIEINLPNFYTQGSFVVTGIDYIYYNELHQIWKITVQQSDIISSYIDIFRPTQSQETESQDASLVISEFIEEEINEIHIIEEVEE